MKKFLVTTTCAAALALGVFATDLLHPQKAEADAPRIQLTCVTPSGAELNYGATRPNGTSAFFADFMQRQRERCRDEHSGDLKLSPIN